MKSSSWLGIRLMPRIRQWKIVKYNHLVVNCVIFYNVLVTIQALAQLEAKCEGISDGVSFI